MKQLAVIPIICLCIVVAALLVFPQSRKLLLFHFSNLISSTTAPTTTPLQVKNPPLSAASNLETRLVQKFIELELRETDYSTRYHPQDSTLEIRASVPRGRPMEWVVWNFTTTAAATTYRVVDCSCSADNNCIMNFKSPDPRHPRVLLRITHSGRYFSNTAKMAILVEDFGFEADQTTIDYLSFPEPLTVSLVPAQRLSSWTSRIANEYKKEVIVLLPMEPLPAQYANYRTSAVMIHFSEEKIKSQFAQSIAAIPDFSGVCNLYGARAMEDSRVMEIILSEVKKRNSYFIYSEISRKSVAPSVARRLKVPSFPILGIIDRTDSPQQIREKLKLYSIAAQKTGKMLVKAPPTPAFISVLKDELNDLRHNGIRLVYVSDLVKEKQE